MDAMANIPRTHFSQVVKLSGFTAALIRNWMQLRTYLKGPRFTMICLYRSCRRHIEPLTQNGLLWSGGVIFLDLLLIAGMMMRL